MDSGYVCQETTGSYCMKCDGLVFLLTPKNETIEGRSFYICFDCRHVVEVGVGVVEIESHVHKMTRKMLFGGD